MLLGPTPRTRLKAEQVKKNMPNFARKRSLYSKSCKVYAKEDVWGVRAVGDVWGTVGYCKAWWTLLGLQVTPSLVNAQQTHNIFTSKKCGRLKCQGPVAQMRNGCPYFSLISSIRVPHNNQEAMPPQSVPAGSCLIRTAHRPPPPPPLNVPYLQPHATCWPQEKERYTSGGFDLVHDVPPPSPVLQLFATPRQIFTSIFLLLFRFFLHKRML